MPKISFIFPGQGAQYMGMGKDFYDTFPESRAVFDTANEILDFDLCKMCFTENSMLHQTQYTQALILTVSEAIRVVLKKQGIEPSLCAGLSLGEYNALLASGILSFKEALLITRQRGILMEQTVPKDLGAMAAVLYLDADIIEEICQSVNGVVEIANYNSPVQHVISGEKQAVEKACLLCKEAGARKVISLKVSGPFHSSLLTIAGQKLAKVLKEVPFLASTIPYYTNVTAEKIFVTKEEGPKIKDLLSRQVYSSVLWKQTIENMLKEGVDLFVEVGPGKTLSGLLRQINKEAKVIGIEKVSELEPLLQALNG